MDARHEQDVVERQRGGRGRRRFWSTLEIIRDVRHFSSSETQRAAGVPAAQSCLATATRAFTFFVYLPLPQGQESRPTFGLPAERSGDARPAHPSAPFAAGVERRPLPSRRGRSAPVATTPSGPSNGKSRRSAATIPVLAAAARNTKNAMVRERT